MLWAEISGTPDTSKPEWTGTQAGGQQRVALCEALGHAEVVGVQCDPGNTRYHRRTPITALMFAPPPFLSWIECEGLLWTGGEWSVEVLWRLRFLELQD